MSAFKFSARSNRNLSGLHPALVTVARAALALTSVDFIVVQGRRTIEEQKRLVAGGKSWTMNSRHLTGHALDFVALDENGKVTWDPKYYHVIWDAFRRAATETGHTLTWGGNWKAGDFGHVQLTWKDYPLEGQTPKRLRKSKTVAASAGTVGAATMQPLIGQLQEAGYIAQNLGEIGQWIAIAISVGLAGFIIYERSKKMIREGV